MKLWERIKFGLSGQGVPVVRLSNVGSGGEFRTIQIIDKVKKRGNSLIETWDQIGWEIDKDPIELIDQKGISRIGYVVDEAGRTVQINRSGKVVANWESIIGKGATLDDIAEALDLNKSYKQLAIGLVVGIGLGSFIIGPMITSMMK